jgi:hypothetical protein
MTQRKLPPRMEIGDCTGVMAGMDSAAVAGVLVGCCWSMVCRSARDLVFRGRNVTPFLEVDVLRVARRFVSRHSWCKTVV